MKMRPILNITHNDMDGAGSAIMVQRALGIENVATERVGYDEIDDITKEALGRLGAGLVDRVIFTDIAPRQWALDRLEGSSIKAFVSIFDHHKNNDWAEHSKQTTIPGMYDENACGTMLACANLIGMDVNINELRLARLIDVYDRWRLDKPDRPQSERLQSYFSLVGFSRFVETMRARCDMRFDWHPSGLPLTVAEIEMLDILDEKDEAYIKSRLAKAEMLTDNDGHRYAWTVASRMTSKIGSALARMEGSEYGAIWNPEYGKVELRSVEGGANVGQIAKARGGGGHDRAAGYILGTLALPW